MADVIKIVPERVKEEAGKVRNCIEEQNDIVDRLGNLVTNLADIWEGKGYDKFVSQYRSIEKDIVKFSSVLEKYAQKMDDSVNTMLHADQTLASKINRL